MNSQWTEILYMYVIYVRSRVYGCTGTAVEYRKSTVTTPFYGGDGPENDIEAFFDTLKYSINSVFHDDQSYEFYSYSNEEQIEFIDSLSVSNIEQCKDFIASMPSVEVEARWKDGNKDKSLTLKGINNFF